MRSRISVALGAIVCFGAVLGYAGDRLTRRADPDETIVTAGEKIDAGYMVCVWTNGLAYTAADTNALAGAKVIGVSRDGAPAGGSCFVVRGKFRLDNQGAALTAADIGSDVYVAGPASVTTQEKASQDIRAGVLAEIQPGADGTNNAVWVSIRF